MTGNMATEASTANPPHRPPLGAGCGARHWRNLHRR